MHEPGSERRRYVRYQRFLSVEYFVNERLGQLKVYTIDISTGGMRVKNPFPIDSAYQFPMCVHLDSTAEVKVIARATWQRKIANEEFYEIGLEFVSMSDEDRRRLTAFVGELAAS